jgi:hypothetical protein
VVYLAAEAITAAGWKSPSYSYAQNWISDLGPPRQACSKAESSTRRCTRS